MIVHGFYQTETLATSSTKKNFEFNWMEGNLFTSVLFVNNTENFLDLKDAMKKNEPMYHMLFYKNQKFGKTNETLAKKLAEIV
jgi:hypothetical protein